jgi:NAD(P)H-nitrite reductase large subunit
MSDESIVCRCEDITLREIHSLIAAGASDLEEIKRACRCGMGPCQGRNCLPLVAQEVAKLTGRPAGDVALPTFRPPASPIKLGALGKGANHD